MSPRASLTTKVLPSRIWTRSAGDTTPGPGSRPPGRLVRSARGIRNPSICRIRIPEDDVIRILLVAQTGLWRKALAAVLSHQEDLEVVAELTRLDEAAASIVHDSRPHVAVLDV